MLLAESPGEVIHPAVQGLMTGDHAPTRANVEQAILDFMDATESHTENIAIVYVAGHGVQFTKDGAVLLLSDFGNPIHHRKKYTGAIDMTAFNKTMDSEDNAHAQFWFLDLCRGLASDKEDYDKLTGILEFDVSRCDSAVASPMFFSSGSGQTAYGTPNKVTLFNEVLMTGLKEGYAAKTNVANDPTWRVTTTSLIDYLTSAMKAIAAAKGKNQKVDIGGRPITACLHECPSPPNVDLTVTICKTQDPDNYSADLKLKGKQVGSTLTKWPARTKVRAGIYIVEVKTVTPPESQVGCFTIEPPTSDMELPLK